MTIRSQPERPRPPTPACPARRAAAAMPANRRLYSPISRHGRFVNLAGMALPLIGNAARGAYRHGFIPFPLVAPRVNDRDVAQLDEYGSATDFFYGERYGRARLMQWSAALP